MLIKTDIFSADYGNNTALGRKERKAAIIDKCNYCEGERRDIFNKKKVCFLCDGSGKIVKVE